MFICDSILNQDDEGNIGYILMVGVDYFVYLQPLHSDLPLLPEKRVFDDKLGYLISQGGRFTIKKICMSNWINGTSFKIQFESRKGTYRYKI